MKLDGKTSIGVRREPIIFPRGEEKIILWAEAQKSFDAFNDLCPIPEPPTYIKPGKAKQMIRDVEDPEYKKQMDMRGEKFSHWLVVASISGTPGLEWEKVKLNDSCTWPLWQDELKEFGLSELEVIHVLNTVARINALTKEELDEAVESFLSESALRSQQNQDSSQSGAAPNTTSGESAKV